MEDLANKPPFLHQNNHRHIIPKSVNTYHLATPKTTRFFLPNEHWKSCLDFLQFHKALVAAFPPVIKISFELDLSTCKLNTTEEN